MSSLIFESLAALRDGGALAAALPQFHPRQAQQHLAQAVAQTISDNDCLLAEAGTGTGKTFAYLVPVLLSGKKTIISTGTKALQDQLYHRDLPRVRQALRSTANVALLKGRANYLCRYRLEQTRGAPRFVSAELLQLLARIDSWSHRTKMGDLSEINDLPEDSPLIAAVTSTTDNCLGNDCPFWSECFVVQARQRAQTADVVVVNHYLLLADLALKEEGFGEILPQVEAFVIDEAHQLPDLAAQFFGEAISARALVELARDVLTESRNVSGALASVQMPAEQLELCVRQLRAQMETLPIRGTRQLMVAAEGIETALDALAQALLLLRSHLALLRAQANALEACYVRTQEFLDRLLRWRMHPPAPPLGADAATDVDLADTFDAEDTANNALFAQAHAQLPDGVHVALSGREDIGEEDDVRWYELSPKGFRLQRTPLDVSRPLRQQRERSKAAWIFTSATLAVAGGFVHFSKRLGLWEPQTLVQPSPFDWQRQALCYLPPNLPQPAAVEFSEALMQAIWPVLEASAGRAFLLFSSLRALREMARLLRAQGNLPWPLFVQGDAPRAQLLEQFRHSGNGVLLGSASFREGVDVAGDALVVVVIDKLPFAPPDDPVFEARLDAIRRAGGSPFFDEQLPQAVIALKQGVGRLIRSETDRGVLVLGDRRLLEKSYGRVFFNSLPPLPRSRNLRDVQEFFTNMAK